MSKIKELFNHMFRALDEFGMQDSPHEEVLAFAEGLRDGEMDKGATWMEGTNSMKEIYRSPKLEGFYKQGYFYGNKGMKANGTKV